MKIFLFLITLSTTIFVGFKNVCSSKTTTVTLSDPSENFTLNLTKDLQGNLSIPSSSTSDVKDYFESIFNEAIGSTFETKAFFNDDKDFITLEIIAQDANQNLTPLANEWVENGANWVIGGNKNKCDGAPCGCCKFEYDKGKVAGCSCASDDYSWCDTQQNERCNHTVEQQ